MYAEERRIQLRNAAISIRSANDLPKIVDFIETYKDLLRKERLLESFQEDVLHLIPCENFSEKGIAVGWVTEKWTVILENKEHLLIDNLREDGSLGY